MIKMATNSNHQRSKTRSPTPDQGRKTPAGSIGCARNVALAANKNSDGVRGILGSSCESNNNKISKTIKAALRAAPQQTTLRLASIRTTTTTSLGRSKKERSKNKTDEATTWDEILSSRTKTSSHPSDFSPIPICKGSNLQQFDPQQTVAFLIMELNSKLKISLPANKTVHRILCEIRSALKRIGHISNASRSTNLTADTNSMEQNREKYCNSSVQTDEYNVRFFEKAIQTNDTVHKLKRSPTRDSLLLLMKEDERKSNCVSEKNFGSHGREFFEPSMSHDVKRKAVTWPSEHSFEERFFSGGNSNNSPRKMEDRLNEKLKEDDIRQRLEELQIEITKLKEQMTSLRDQLDAANVREAYLIQELENRCKLLQNELKTLQDIVKKQTKELGIVQDLSAKLKESAMKINHLEKSKLEADRILVFTKLEKEKLAMIRKFQENQVRTLQPEINRLTKIVQKQLQDIDQDSNIFQTSRMESDTASVDGTMEEIENDDSEPSTHEKCHYFPDAPTTKNHPIPQIVTALEQTDTISASGINQNQFESLLISSNGMNHEFEHSRRAYPKLVDFEIESKYLINKNKYDIAQNKNNFERKQFDHLTSTFRDFINTSKLESLFTTESSPVKMVRIDEKFTSKSENTEKLLKRPSPIEQRETHETRSQKANKIDSPKTIDAATIQLQKPKKYAQLEDILNYPLLQEENEFQEDGKFF